MSGSLRPLIRELQRQFPALSFAAGKQFSWSPDKGVIMYNPAARGEKALWSLLHETGHALLAHDSYKADYELLRIELAAWEKAKEIATSIDMIIDEEHIQDCLETYRSWLYKRCICPTCNAKCLQQDDYEHYRCFNCQTTWRVSRSRFVRTYRRQKEIAQKSALFYEFK